MCVQVLMESDAGCSFNLTRELHRCNVSVKAPYFITAKISALTAIQPGKEGRNHKQGDVISE